MQSSKKGMLHSNISKLFHFNRDRRRFHGLNNHHLERSK